MMEHEHQDFNIPWFNGPVPDVTDPGVAWRWSRHKRRAPRKPCGSDSRSSSRSWGIPGEFKHGQQPILHWWILTTNDHAYTWIPMFTHHLSHTHKVVPPYTLDKPNEHPWATLIYHRLTSTSTIYYRCITYKAELYRIIGGIRTNWTPSNEACGAPRCSPPPSSQPHGLHGLRGLHGSRWGHERLCWMDIRASINNQLCWMLFRRIFRICIWICICTFP